MNTWVNFAKLCLNKKIEQKIKNVLRLALELRTTLIFLAVCLIYSCRRLKRKSITNFYLFIYFSVSYSLLFSLHNQAHTINKTYNKKIKN